MIRYELEDKEADYLASLLMKQPLGEAIGLYLKLAQQTQVQQRAQPVAVGPQTLANGSVAPEAHPEH